MSKLSHILAVELSPKKPFRSKSRQGYADGTFTVRGNKLHNYHLWSNGAPDQWTHDQGATHTVHLSKTIGDDWGVRGAIIHPNRKSVKVMVDEDENGAVWEKWAIKRFNDYDEDDVPQHNRIVYKPINFRGTRIVNKNLRKNKIFL